MAVLEWVADQAADPTVKGIATHFDLNLSTCYHVVNTLICRGYLLKGEDRRIRLGPRLGYLSQRFVQKIQPARDLVSLVEDLSRTTGETAYLARWEDGDVVLQTVVEGPRALRVAGLHPGFRGASHCRASGKAVLAFISTSDLETFFDRVPLSARTPHTITNPRTLRETLKQIRQSGIAIDNEEYTLGVCCLSAPIFDASGAIWGALTVSMPSMRFRDSLVQVRATVADRAADASRRLGFAHCREASVQSAQGAVLHVRNDIMEVSVK